MHVWHGKFECYLNLIVRRQPAKPVIDTVNVYVTTGTYALLLQFRILKPRGFDLSTTDDYLVLFSVDCDNFVPCGIVYASVLRYKLNEHINRTIVYVHHTQSYNSVQ